MAHPDTHIAGRSYLIAWCCLGAMVIWCYVRTVLQHPGTIPDKDVCGDDSWEYVGNNAQPSDQALDCQESKRLGDRRHCKWCSKYKPDRCHHCRVCNMCILKMDHHCPWVYNCVGFHNFKYFFLLIMYSVIALHWMVWTMVQRMIKVLDEPTMVFIKMFLILFGFTLAGIFCVVLTLFFAFHVYLMLKAMTTIEFCEKSRRPHLSTTSYSRGVIGNIKAVLGDYVLLWVLPVSPPSGDGLTFVTEEAVSEDTPLLGDKNIEEGGGMKRKKKEGKDNEKQRRNSE